MGIGKPRLSEKKGSSELLIRKQSEALREIQEHCMDIYRILLENVSKETNTNQCHVKLKELEFWSKHHLSLAEPFFAESNE